MTVSSERRERRDKARDKRQERPRQKKRVDALHARIEDIEVLARVLNRKHGLELGAARAIAFAANPVAGMLAKRGQPPTNFELYEAVESIRAANEGTIPKKPGVPFWTVFARHWNAVNSESPERQYVGRDGKPDWRGLEAAYQVARRRLERAAAALATRAGA